MKRSASCSADCRWPPLPDGTCADCDHLAELRQELTQCADDFLERASTPKAMADLRDSLLTQIDDAMDSYTADVLARVMKRRRKR